MKFLQYCIVRGCLKTNNTVHHIKPNVSPLCAYCGLENELIYHLFVQCNVVKVFWSNLANLFIDDLIIDIPTDRKSIIFGIHSKPFDSIENYVILAAKQYIWTNKFREPHTPLLVNAFINILKYKIEELKNVYKILKDNLSYEQWDNVLFLL